MIAPLLNIPCTLHYAEVDGTDDYNNPVIIDNDVTSVCWIEQVNRSEDTVDSDRQASTWNLYLPSDTALADLNRVTVGATVYEFDGPPWQATHPVTQVASHVEARLRVTV